MDDASVSRVSNILERVRRGSKKILTTTYRTDATNLTKYTNELQDAFPVYSAAQTPQKLDNVYKNILNIFTSKKGTIYDSRLKTPLMERQKIDIDVIKTLNSLINVTKRMTDHSDPIFKLYGSTLGLHAKQLLNALVDTAPLPPPVVT